MCEAGEKKGEEFANGGVYGLIFPCLDLLGSVFFFSSSWFVFGEGFTERLCVCYV